MTARSADVEADAVVNQRDEAAIVAVALDYFEGWFDGDAARMRRALHPELAKRRGGSITPSPGVSGR